MQQMRLWADTSNVFHRNRLCIGTARQITTTFRFAKGEVTESPRRLDDPVAVPSNGNRGNCASC